MNEQSIVDRMNEISEIAEKRMKELSDNQMGNIPNHTSGIHFMTDEEREEFHQLRIQLPSSGERMAAAQKRLKERLEKRKRS